jgi:hypothetical protein
MELATLQQLFYDAIFQRSERVVEQISRYIVSTPGLTAADRLAIYRKSVISKLTQTLNRIYPVSQRLVGEKCFKAIALSYIEQYSSLSSDLGHYGEQLSDFIAQSPIATMLPYLADVTRLEWHWHRIFTGADSLLFDFKTLATIPSTQWGQIIFHLPPTAALLASAYPIHRIWAVNQPDYRGESLVHLEEGGIKLFLWRQEYTQRMEFLSEEEWLLLHQFQENKTFAAICEALSQTTLNIPISLQQFVQRGWISHFTVES